MPLFNYQGRDSKGELIQGQSESASSHLLAEELIRTGIIPLDISPIDSNSLPKNLETGWRQFFSEKISATDLLLFSRQMHTLIKSGVPILRALEGLEASTPNQNLKNLLRTVRNDLDMGKELSVSFSQHPKIFTPFYISMVQIGEMTGALDQIFLKLYRYLEFELEMRQRIKSALRYPAFVITAIVAAIVIINILVIPIFAKVYSGFDAELPAVTLFLIGFSDVMVESWPIMLAVVCAMFFGLQIWLRTENGRMHWDRFKLQIPIVGSIVNKATLARFARAFALSFKSGIPIVQSMAVVAQVVGNKHIATAIQKMREGVERGESVYQTAINVRVFNPIVLQMIAVGEETGELDAMLDEVAVMYEREVTYEIRTLSQNIEPILIIGLGGLVVVLALGVFLPIWELGSVAIR